jgi:hypothetical protein
MVFLSAEALLVPLSPVVISQAKGMISSESAMIRGPKALRQLALAEKLWAFSATSGLEHSNYFD